MTDPSAAVDLLLGTFRTALPPPAMCGRPGKAHGLIRTVTRWETGGTDLRVRSPEAYARPLAERSAQHPEALVALAALVASAEKSVEMPP
ncbi:hypothetical protein ACFXPW_19110 [Streptomyces goshikiensis]|uniref:hypothetical protein n=1 Tax=Streptomyces goshikiensis TaxID=1942 RepID=UPI003679DBB5